MDRIKISVSGLKAVISNLCRRLVVKISHVARFGILSDNTISLEEIYKKKLGEIRIPKLHLGSKLNATGSLPESLDNDGKNLSFSLHNILRSQMFLCEDMR